MIKTILHKAGVTTHEYPAFQADGFAAQFAFPFAEKVCTGIGLDIGCNRLEWALPENKSLHDSQGGRIVYPIDPELGMKNAFAHSKQGEYFDAMTLPDGTFDFIFSSHCLEHVPHWSNALDYWAEKIKPGGVLFLYLPDFSQSYWRPYYNKKHYHVFTPEILHQYFSDRCNLWGKSFVSGADLNNSFMCMAERRAE